jgi:hypothetical protein
MCRRVPLYQPCLDAICWIEDYAHGPTRLKRLNCWVSHLFLKPCEHDRRLRIEELGKSARTELRN